MDSKMAVLILAFVTALLLAGCAPLPPAPGAVPAPTPSPTPLSPAEVFARVAPSVAFVDTPTGTGSGFLIQEGYLVTNAHVVYPLTTVRVVFADGSEFPAAPVRNWDLMADLALVGPLTTTLPGLLLDTDAPLTIGSPTYLIGYPQEIETFPQPSITAGVLSRLREWDAIDVTYLQSDALILGGQSGGVLVSAQGEVLGVSGLTWPGFSQFALVASIVDLRPRIQALAAGEDPSGLGQRGLPGGDPAAEAEIVFQHRHDARAFQVLGEAGDSITLTLEGAAAFRAIAFDFAGSWYAEDEASEADTFTWEIEYGDLGPMLLDIQPLAEGPLTVTVRSSQPLLPFDDPDDGRTIQPGESLFGSIDQPTDTDAYVINLEADQRIEARLDSLAFDALLELVAYDEPSTLVTSDDDSGGGLYEDAAKLTYQAAEPGAYLLVVKKFTSGFYVDVSTGGYRLAVEEVVSEASEPTPEADSEAAEVGVDEGDEETTFTYTDSGERFSLDVPSDWRMDSGFDEELTRFLGPEGGMLQINPVDVLLLGLGELTQTEYVDLLVDYYQATQEDFVLESRTTVTVTEALTGEVLVFTDLGGRRRTSAFIYTADGEQAVVIAFSAPVADHAALEPLIERTFQSFRWLD